MPTKQDARPDRTFEKEERGNRISRNIRKAAIVFAVTALLTGLVFYLLGRRKQSRIDENLQYTAENEAGKFRQELEYYIQVSGYLESLLVSGEGDSTSLAELSDQLLEEYPGVVEVWLAPDGKVAQSFPEDEGVKGLDVTGLEVLPIGAETFIGSGETVILGPQKVESITVSTEGGQTNKQKSYLQQALEENTAGTDEAVEEFDQGFTVSDVVMEQLSDRVFIIYNPVYLDGQFWGFVNIVVSAYSVFYDSGLLALEDAGYNYMLYQMNSNFDLYSVLSCGDSLENPAEALFMIGGWEWSVDVAQQSAWASRTFGVPQVLISLLLGLLVALLYAYILRHREVKALIVEQNEEISEKSGQLEQEKEANRAKTEFVSRISHDIRTPIGAILNLTEFAKRDMDDREKLEKDLDRIDSSGKFLLSLINDVLDISKVDSGKIELNCDVINYDSYLKSLSDLMETMCGEKNQTFHLQSDHTPGLCFKADKVRLRQISLNLLSNAVKYSPEGTTVSYISTVKETDGGENVALSFAVKDEGIGMSEEFQKVMFDEFSQEYDNPLRDGAIQGTGLGLPIVKKLVDLMGGTIAVQSERGKGTDITVSFIFPKAETERVATPYEEEAAANEKLAALVLFAEDNEINTIIANRIFEEMGVTADHAANGQEAVEMFMKSQPGYYDAIFMDLQMPVMDGLTAAEKIRGLERMDAQAVPIVAMTADAFKEAMDKAYSVGMNEYITKPLEPKRIREIIRKIVNR